MIRTTGLAFVAATALWAQAVNAQDFSKVEVKAAQVSGNVYVLTGAGGNIGAIVGPDGIVIVDDQFAPLADKIRAALKGVSDRPVRFVINTHFHGDHAGGNAPFSEGGATVVAQDNVRKRLMTGGPGGNGMSMKQMNPKAAPEALPVITFDHDLTIHVNGEDVRALHAPHGHTDGDAIVFFPKANVVHMGDLFVRYGFPFIDITSGGSSAGMIAALEDAAKRLPADVKVIPGHGALSTIDDVRAYVTMLKETRAAVAAGVKAGKSVDQLKQEKVLARWQSYSGDFITTDPFIETLYAELTGKGGAGFVKHN